MPDLWLACNPTAAFTGNRRGWPTYLFPNGVRVLVGKVERNVSGEANFAAAVEAMPCRRISLSVHPASAGVFFCNAQYAH